LDLLSLLQWRSWLQQNPWVFDKQVISLSVSDVTRSGIIDPIFGFTPPNRIDTENTNYREGLIAHGLSSRSRGVMQVLIDEIIARKWPLRIYAPEYLTPLASVLRAIVDFEGSEYLPTDDQQRRHQNVPHQDVMALTFRDESFDGYISCEVLEHIPDIGRALAEAYRILKPGGLFFGTFPFAYMNEESVHKAKLVDAEIAYLTEPEYHGNPVDSEHGSLVYTVPGWDFLQQASSVGFSHNSLQFISSRRHGIFGTEIAGVFVFKARRG
jgi:SAM-dependent methyltransferase